MAVFKRAILICSYDLKIKKLGMIT